MRSIYYVLVLSLAYVVRCGPALNNKLKFALNAGEKQYYISQSADNFYQAYQFCRAQDMQLLTVASASESEAVQQVLAERDPGEVTNLWTSGNRLGNEVDFFWLSSGKFVTYSDWSDGQPTNAKEDELCIELVKVENSNSTQTYKWGLSACTYQRHFICEIVTACS